MSRHSKRNQILTKLKKSLNVQLPTMGRLLKSQGEDIANLEKKSQVFATGAIKAEIANKYTHEKEWPSKIRHQFLLASLKLRLVKLQTTKIKDTHVRNSF